MDLFNDFDFENFKKNIDNQKANNDLNEIKIEYEMDKTIEDEVEYEVKEEINEESSLKRSLKNIWKKPNLNKYIKIDTQKRDESINEFLNQVNNAMEKIRTLVIDRFEGNIAVCENRQTRWNDRYW